MNNYYIFAGQLERPTECDILLSRANASLMPSKSEEVDNPVLWQGPLGSVVSGSHNSLNEKYTMNVRESSTHLALSLKSHGDIYVISDKGPVLGISDFEGEKFWAGEISNCYRCRLSLHSTVKDLIHWFKYDQIGASCTPLCGSCRCGNCSVGSKQMTLKKEKELKQIEDCLTFMPHGDKHCSESQWDVNYPYIISPTNLPDNYKVVKGVLMSSLRRLNRDTK